MEEVNEKARDEETGADYIDGDYNDKDVLNVFTERSINPYAAVRNAMKKGTSKSKDGTSDNTMHGNSDCGEGSNKNPRLG